MIYKLFWRDKVVRVEQICGMMLEEALLYLLRLSGYRTVESPINGGKYDPTLEEGSSGLEVRGRGGVHQIDAIADFAIGQPFSNPQRLLLEAKFLKNKTGIEIVRNALGVLKDVSEYWISRDNVPHKARYHYQYAIFSKSDYTVPAQKYAYAHDIYLIPLNKSKFFAPVISAIEQVKQANVEQTTLNELALKSLRYAIRNNLRDNDTESRNNLIENYRYRYLINNFCSECHRLEGSILAMLQRQFPIFLVPNPDGEIRIENIYKLSVKIYWDFESWYLLDAETNEYLFSFDLPKELFNLYADDNILSQSQALNLKADYMSEIQAIIVSDNRVKIITFFLDRDWFNTYS